MADIDSIDVCIRQEDSQCMSVGFSNNSEISVALYPDECGYTIYLSEFTGVYGDGSGESGTKDYNELSNKPQIEGVTLKGNKSFPQLGLTSVTNSEIYWLVNN